MLSWLIARLVLELTERCSCLAQKATKKSILCLFLILSQIKKVVANCDAERCIYSGAIAERSRKVQSTWPMPSGDVSNERAASAHNRIER
jgi:hypothetical protein